MKKKILVISPAFPPYSGVGSKRMGSLINYISNFDNFSLLVIKNNNDMWSSNLVLDKVNPKIPTIDIRCNNPNSFFKMQKLYSRFIYEQTLLFKPDIIIISSGPFYTLKPIKKIRRDFKIKIILEFRDLWLINPRKPKGIVGKLKFFLLNFFQGNYLTEFKAINNSSKIIVTSSRDKEILMRKYFVKYEKISIIKNGFDRVLSKKLLPKREENLNAFKICLFGKFSYYSKASTLIFYNALNYLSLKTKIQVVHIGEKEPFVENLFNKNINENISYYNTGFLKYEDGLLKCYKSDLLLLIEDSPTGFGTKIFDYIMVNKPVLLIARNPGLLGELISSFKNGFVSTSELETKKIIEYIILNNLQCLDNLDNIDKFSRERQNQKYLEIINELLRRKE
ncbi:MAG TPA: hypothetical protein PLR16_05540 [Bacilli bacterium]|nr:MAG: hypothetical protein BWY97_01063 [Tenericutes bacterium ADurb.BinA124]HPX84720.1 hypothetical protein [Bacilli bacterium]